MKVANPFRRRKGAERDGAQMSLIDHLHELRSRLVKCVLAIALGAVVCYLVYDRIFRFMTAPYCESLPRGEDCRLLITDYLEGFLTKVKVAGYGGIIAALPVILWQLWRFIMPGLYKNERRYTLAFVVSATALFALGAALAYYTLPTMYSWLASNSGPQQDLQQFQTVDRYFWTAALMMIGFGIGFEFPILLIALQLVGVLENVTLRQWRRQAAVLIVVVVAVITPGGDPISLLALSVPMYLFYELSIGVGWLVARRRRRASERELQPAG